MSKTIEIVALLSLCLSSYYSMFPLRQRFVSVLTSGKLNVKIKWKVKIIEDIKRQFRVLRSCLRKY